MYFRHIQGFQSVWSIMGASYHVILIAFGEKTVTLDGSRSEIGSDSK